MNVDRRERRVRNTLTVDLGIYGLPLLDNCMEQVVMMLRARGKEKKARRLNRGQLVRMALKVLALTLQGVREPLPRALDELK